jgi:hypothetical protein
LIWLFPDGFLALFAPAAALPALLPPAPLIDDPVVLDGEPVEPAAPVPTDPPPAPPPPAWANARVFESANAVANAIVVSFMVVSFLSQRRGITGHESLCFNAPEGDALVLCD